MGEALAGGYFEIGLKLGLRRMMKNRVYGGGETT